MIDAIGCDPELLRDRAALESLFARIIAEVQLKPLRSVWHQFDGPGGLTGMVLLSESHLTCHTYPEFGSATFNLYCCRERPEWPWRQRLSEMLGAAEVSVRTFERSAIPALQAVGE